MYVWYQALYLPLYLPVSIGAVVCKYVGMRVTCIWVGASEYWDYASVPCRLWGEMSVYSINDSHNQTCVEIPKMITTMLKRLPKSLTVLARKCEMTCKYIITFLFLQ